MGEWWVWFLFPILKKRQPGIAQFAKNMELRALQCFT
ncbi:hypothetical protein CHISP_0715 [Chitinispirillum alkaliphilum]|nr:hypothetical protein CHISP_0715 [Chitinispirillum alkaliphilum]